MDYIFKVAKKGREDTSWPEIHCPGYLVPGIYPQYPASLNISSKYLKTHHLGFSFVIFLPFTTLSKRSTLEGVNKAASASQPSDPKF